MHHFGEMSRAGRAHMSIATLWRRERFENRLTIIYDIFFPTDHKGITFGQTPDAAADARIYIVQAHLGEFWRAAFVVRPPRIRAIYDNVALVQHRRDLINRSICRLSRRQHEPDDA